MNYRSAAYGARPGVPAAKTSTAKIALIVVGVIVGGFVVLGAIAIALGVGLGLGLRKSSSGSSGLSAPIVVCNATSNASLITCGCPVTSPTFSSRIINGVATTTNSWPWMVAVYIGNTRICSGFLITNRHVITARNCVNAIPAVNLTVYAGITALSNRNNGQNLSVSNIYTTDTFGNYSATGTLGDIAILRLGINVTFGSTVSPCCYTSNTSLPVLYDHAVIAGWGEVSLVSSPSDTLQQGVVQVLSPSTCSVSSTDPSQFCAHYGAISTCPADNGGPLMTSVNNAWTCTGIISGGSATCYQYAPYVRLSYYYPFIANVTASS